MGYAHYTVYRNGQRIEAGYAVEDTCNDQDCPAQIDRGLDFLCGQMPGGDEDGCGGYFCHSHLFMHPAEGPQLCDRCRTSLMKRRCEDFTDTLVAALADLPGIKTAMAEADHPRIFIELTDGLELTIEVR